MTPAKLHSPRTAEWAVAALRTIAANMRAEGFDGSRPDVLEEVAESIAIPASPRAVLGEPLDEQCKCSSSNILSGGPRNFND